MKSFLRFSTFAFFVFCTSSVFAQCDKPVKGSFSPLVEQRNSFESDKGSLCLVGYGSVENSIFPFHFEWREETKTGKIIKTGIVQTAKAKSNDNFDLRTVSNLEPGKYVLITYDSSIPCKTSTYFFEIK